MRVSLATSCCAGLLLCGCLAQSHVLTDPVPLDGFCDAFFDAICGPIEECGCGAAALADCRQQQRDLCATFPTDALRAAVEEGRLGYDPVEATALARRMRERGCE